MLDIAAPRHVFIFPQSSERLFIKRIPCPFIKPEDTIAGWQGPVALDWRFNHNFFDSETQFSA
jgi:hypothetical protein